MKFHYIFYALFCMVFFSCSQPGKPSEIQEKTQEKQLESAGNLPAESSANALSQALQKILEKFKDKVPQGGYRVTIDNLVIKDSEIPSAFSEELRNEISVAINNCGFLQEYPREQLDAILKQHKISVSTFFDSQNAPKIGALKTIQGMIQGSYLVSEEEGIKVYLHLLDIESGQKLASASGSVQRKSKISMPPNYKQSQEILKNFSPAQKPGFKVQVWTDRGKGSVYRVGERLNIHFESEKDCYLKLYHINAKGEIQLIFPNHIDSDNRIQANTIYSIPGENYGFEFIMSHPLGAEMIKAIASTSPFQNIETSGVPLGNSPEMTKSIIQEARKLKGLEIKPLNSEEICIYSIVE